MEYSFKYDRSIGKQGSYKDTVKYWNNCMDLYEKKNYKESIINFLYYMNPDLVKEKSKNNNTEFKFPHGSMIINFLIDNDSYEISAPFIKVPEKKAVILLRQVCEINFSKLTLSQILSKNNELYFYYKSPLALCYPYKLWDLFYEICVNSDYYDDLFITQLQATRINEMEVKKYSNKEIEEFWKTYNEIIDFGIEGCKEYQNKRWFNFGVDHGFITLMKLDHVLNPQGIIGNYILDYFLYNNKLNDEENLSKLIENLNKLKSIDKKIFEESIYQPVFLISPKRHADLEFIKNYLKDIFETAKTNITSSNFISAAYSMLYKFYYILFSYSIPIELEIEIITALEKSSKNNFTDTAKILYDAVEVIINKK